VLSNHPVIGDLGHLFTALPPTARGVVAMRSDPPWSLHQLRLDDRLVEIRGADLAFAEADAQALLEDVSRTSLTDAQVALLVERTDGWAAGLQLAAISLRTSRDIPGFVESFAGSDHLVSEYLLHEVIDEQEPGRAPIPPADLRPRLAVGRSVQRRHGPGDRRGNA
jgi:LuxR family maltose regulon positive regulatory protein